MSATKLQENYSGNIMVSVVSRFKQDNNILLNLVVFITKMNSLQMNLIQFVAIIELDFFKVVFPGVVQFDYPFIFHGKLIPIQYNFAKLLSNLFKEVNPLMPVVH